MILVIAYTFRGVTGFGSALISIPLLAFFVPLTIAVPFINVLDTSASLIHTIHTRKAINWPVILRTLPYTLLGVSLALFLLQVINPELLVRALGAFIILFAIYSLLAPSMKQSQSRLWPAFGGFFGGYIGTWFGTGGPFYVIYFRIQQLDKSAFRASCAAVFLIDGLIRITGYTLSGFYTSELLLLCLASIPVMLVALYIGEHIHTSVSQQGFQRVIGVFLIFSGAALLLK